MTKKRPYVVVRTYSAGVHVGVLELHKEKEVCLSDARRLWYWKGAFTLSEVSQSGVDQKESRISVAVPSITLTEAIEIIICSKEAEEILRRLKKYSAQRRYTGHER